MHPKPKYSSGIPLRKGNTGRVTRGVAFREASWQGNGVSVSVQDVKLQLAAAGMFGGRAAAVVVAEELRHVRVSSVPGREWLLRSAVAGGIIPTRPRIHRHAPFRLPRPDVSHPS
ncbi:unnamed protein product [Lota lota]